MRGERREQRGLECKRVGIRIAITNERTNERTYGRTDARMDGWTDVRMGRWTYGRKYGRIDGCCTHALTRAIVTTDCELQLAALLLLLLPLLLLLLLLPSLSDGPAGLWSPPLFVWSAAESIPMPVSMSMPMPLSMVVNESCTEAMLAPPSIHSLHELSSSAS